MALSSSLLPGRLAAVNFEHALVLEEPDGPGRHTQLVLGPAAQDGRTFQFFTKALSADARWSRHAHGQIMTGPTAQDAVDEGWQSLAGRLSVLPVEAFYQAAQQVGIAYGPAFRGLAALWTGAREALAEVRTPPELSTHSVACHPAVLDACLQVAGAVVDQNSHELHVPFQLDALELLASCPHTSTATLACARQTQPRP